MIYIFLVTLFRIYFTVAYLTSWFIVRSQYLVRLLSWCWNKGCHTIHPPIEGLLLPNGTEPTPFTACEKRFGMPTLTMNKYIYIYIYWQSSAPGALSTLVTSVVLYLLTRATLMSPGKDETRVCGYIYIYIYVDNFNL